MGQKIGGGQAPLLPLCAAGAPPCPPPPGRRAARSLLCQPRAASWTSPCTTCTTRCRPAWTGGRRTPGLPPQPLPTRPTPCGGGGSNHPTLAQHAPQVGSGGGTRSATCVGHATSRMGSHLLTCSVCLIVVSRPTSRVGHASPHVVSRVGHTMSRVGSRLPWMGRAWAATWRTSAGRRRRRCTPSTPSPPSSSSPG